MAKIAYQAMPNFRAKTLADMEQANEIIEHYARQGYRLTVRQIYYQLVARALIPNNEASYKRIIDLLSKARLAGIIDWDHIEDRTRNIRGNSHWETPGSVIKSAAYSFALDRWSNQEVAVEVYVEKDALLGVIAPVCRSLDVRYMSSRGYMSLSEVEVAAGRIRRHVTNRKKVLIVHLGDHDPSGQDMTRDIGDRLEMFLNGGDVPYRTGVAVTDTPPSSLSADVTIQRIALNWDQIQAYRPPPNFSKESDSRYQGYVDKYGVKCYELDALEPSVISDLIRATVSAHINQEAWDSVERNERQIVAGLHKAANNWDDVQSFLDEIE